MTTWTPERRARAGLSAIARAAAPDLAGLMTTFGAEAVWERLNDPAEDSALGRRARALHLESFLDALPAGMRFLVPGDAEWPAALDDLDRVEHLSMTGRPIGLWAIGPAALAPSCTRAVSIVGSRAATNYGTRVASDLAAELAEGPDPLVVVSGGAYGVDAAAHRGALAGQCQTGMATTVAVLAGGLDEFYPRGNSDLLARIAAEHLCISEVAPGQHPTRQGFLARNRIIAALGAGTVLVEAAVRSGALNTVAWAGALGRVVMAVPGSIYSAASVSPNARIAAGDAAVVCGADDVRALLDQNLLPIPARTRQSPTRVLDGVPAALVQVREVLPGRGGWPLGKVAAATGLSIPECLERLGRLQLERLVCQRPDGTWGLS